MKRQAIYGLCVATSAVALMTGCATKQDSSAARARQEAMEVTAAEERAMQAEVGAEPAPVITPAPDAEPAPAIDPAPAPGQAGDGQAAEPAAQRPVKRPEPAVYTVTAGDSVSALSVRFGVRQPDILALNPDLRANPDRLKIGQQVLLPPGTDVSKAPRPRAATPAAAPKAGETVYTVQPGDVLGGIALTHGVDVATIKQANNLRNDTIFVGQKLRIPGAKARGRVVAAKDPAAKPAPKADTPKAEPAPKADAPKAEPAPVAAPVDEEPLPDQVGEEALPPPPAPQGEGDGAAIAPPPPAPEAKPATQMQTYVVQPNEDLVGISLKWGVMLPALREANNLADDVNEVAPGTTLKIPMAAQ